MDNQDFFRAWTSLLVQAPCMALFEDIDNVFDGRKNITKSELTFDFLLNSLDGAKRPDGVLCIMSTNHPEKMDPALIRPGRVDRIAEFHPIDFAGLVKIATRILADEQLARKLAMEYGTESPAEFQERCFRLAIEQKFAERAKLA